MKLELFSAWFMFGGGIVAIIIIIILMFLGEGEPMLYARGFIAIPFAFWYGRRCLHKYNELKAMKDGEQNDDTS